MSPELCLDGMREALSVDQSEYKDSAGFTLTVPDPVMSLTLVAAGVSVQDALSGIFLF